MSTTNHGPSYPFADVAVTVTCAGCHHEAIERYQLQLDFGGPSICIEPRIPVGWRIMFGAAICSRRCALAVLDRVKLPEVPTP